MTPLSRQLRILRRVARGTVGGRSEQAARVPTRPRPATHQAGGGSGGYEPLHPWSLAEDSTWGGGLSAIYANDMIAPDRDGPSLDLGFLGGDTPAMAFQSDASPGSSHEASVLVDRNSYTVVTMQPNGGSSVFTELVAASASPAAPQATYDVSTPNANAVARADMDGATWNLTTAGNPGASLVAKGVGATDAGKAWFDLYPTDDALAPPPYTPGSVSYIYSRVNGSGKREWVIQFHTGSPQVFATEP